MKTSEFKEIINSHGFYIDENSLDLCIMSPTGTLAMIYKTERSRFKIDYPDILGNEAIDAIVEYAKTPIDERKEKYINVDIPVSNWEKINSGFSYSRDESNENKANIRFLDEEGFDAMFVTLRLIHAKYEELK